MSEPREFTFQEMMRAGHVKRWQIVRVAREQTIAEHMWRVWAITNLIGRLLEVPGELSFLADQWALFHDTPEVITGDIATPVKAEMRKAVPEGDPMRTIELSLSDTYRRIWEYSKKHISKGWPTAYELVKLADLMEASCFLACEGIGSHAKIVHEGIQQAVTDAYAKLRQDYPTVEWHRIRHIINESWTKV